MQAREGFSLDAQLQDCQALAAELGATVTHEPFTDNDSGAELDLDGLNAMLDAAGRREFDVLIVYDMDRLARNLAKQLAVEQELRKYGVAIHDVRGGSVEDSPEGRALCNTDSL
jgi:site-specific DNA recombinase